MLCSLVQDSNFIHSTGSHHLTLPIGRSGTKQLQRRQGRTDGLAWAHAPGKIVKPRLCVRVCVRTTGQAWRGVSVGGCGDTKISQFFRRR